MSDDRSAVVGELGPVSLVFLSIINVIFILTGCLGNCLVVFMILKDARLRNPMNYIIISLSISDLLVSALGQPVYLFSLHGVQNDIFHVFYLTVTSTSLYASLNHLLCISLNRLVVRPFRHESTVSNKTFYIIALIWLLSIIESLLRAFTAFRVATVYIRISAIFVFVAIYGRIFYIAKQQRRKIMAQRMSVLHNYPLAQLSKSLALSKTGLIIVISFIFSFLPVTVALMIGSSKQAIEWTFTLMLCSSAFNPLIYACRNKQLKMGIFKLIDRR